ncbi:MAG: hypothetical protein HOC71_10700 [Candidatus Latescibacteria bacterium]|jgi:ATP-dependent helicase/DNAse subunit B|nr:hypothetical protein [Candidatus Latescibacterota bacterium]
MNLTVITGPDPSANLTELFKRIPLSRGPVCAVVPDNRSVTTMQKRLADLSGGVFLGHRVYTLERLAMEILSLSGDPPAIIKGYMKRAIIAEIIKNRIRENSKYFSISACPGFVNLLISFLEEIRSRTDGRISKGPELVWIASAYGSHIEKLGLNDHEGVVATALEGEKIESFASSFTGPLIVDGFYDLTGRQFELFKRLFRSFSRSAVTLANDPLRPALFGTSERLFQRYLTLNPRVIEDNFSPSTGPDRVLSEFMGGVYPDDSDTGDVEIHTFRSESSEAGWIAGTIRSMLLKGTLRPDDIMIVSRFQKNFGSPIERALRLYGIPVQGGFSRPFITHPVVRLALDALEASIHPEKEELMSSVQKSHYTGNSTAEKRNLLESMDEKGWSCRIAEPNSPEEYVKSFIEMLDDLGVSGNLDGGGEEEYAISETAAYERFLELMGEFADLYREFPHRKIMNAAEFKQLFIQFLGAYTIPDKPFPSGALVVDVNHARYIKRDVVFITGLDDALFPASDMKYSLHDKDIARELHEHYREEEPLLFYMAAKGARQLFLTFPGIDDEGRDDSMSPYLREIRESLRPQKPTQFHPGIPGAAWEHGASGMRGQAEQLVRALSKDFNKAPSILYSVGMKDPALGKQVKNAVKALIYRDTNMKVNLSEHPSFEDVRLEWSTNRVFSITELEMYLSCPFKFFLSRFIGLSVDIRIPGELDPATRGMIVHEILARFYIERRKRAEKTRFDKTELSASKDLMREIVDTIFSRSLHSYEGVHPVALNAEKKFIKTWMEAFLENEMYYFEQTDFEPCAIEIEFGRPARGENEHYSALNLGNDSEQVLIGGRIDRIDADSISGKRRIRIIDYKTGFVEAKAREMSDGADLQIPLYLEAAVKNILPGSFIHDGVYYSLKDMEFKTYKKERRPITGTDWNDFIDGAVSRAVLAVSEIRKGCFSPPEKKCDEYCEFLSLCRGGKKNEH